MSKLDSIRQLLNNKPDLVWNEQSSKREHLRHEGSHYYSIAIQVAPTEPILTSFALKDFSEKLSLELAQIGTTNITECYEYAETKHDVIKTATLYYSEEINLPEEKDTTERRIAVTIYPCEVMSENMGIRGVIEISHYECPNPCEQFKQCTFKGYWRGPVDSILDIRFPFRGSGG
ncbi:MAG: hypothetical protein HQ553_00820 [Chloroflexi bacterium]|nr:hypothetical protein [Chloroflexota bacterium]